MNILMVLTSHNQLGDTGHKTGFWLEEFASPYYLFKDRNFTVTLASPKGGQPPVDPMSEQPDHQTAATLRFSNDDEAKEQLANTLRLDSVEPENFDAIFYPGGHGPLWDLAEDKHSISLIEQFARQEKPAGFVCHGPAVLRHVKGIDGRPLVSGKRVTGFSNSEEAAVQLTGVVPFSVEDMLTANGGLYIKADDWTNHVQVDGRLITGQNPASSESTALHLVKVLKK
ncbi:MULTISPECIES: type 1 glutamine amidotransferase domain-containing protein [Desulfosediminicola]|uniref:type 1 glutamine amidotransferase domain-containing protein n=1 Tax=Desulfosediminicola TaxID=2886823 RepID=UPI0010AC9E65|nr:type 1 glutamine amidotransferase domain-containing protein [Desulfosediminicola ganghwensis]